MDYNESIAEDNINYNTNDYPVYLQVWVTIVSAIVFTIGVCGNVLVPILVWKNKQLRHSTNIFLLNLAVADVLILLICLPTAMVELYTTPNTWVLGSVLCRFVPFIEISVCRASVFTLTVISVERYIAICKPLRTTSLCTRPRAMSVCFAIWPMSFLAACPVLMITKHELKRHLNGQNEPICFNPLVETWMSNYYLVSAGVFFLLPLFFLATVYFLITKRLLSQRARASKKSNDSHWRSRKQVAGMLGAVVGLFFVSLLPFQIFIVWVIQTPEEQLETMEPHTYYNVLFACRILVYVNSAVNPIIYNAMSAKFRRALLKLFAKPTDLSKGLLRRHSTFNTTTSSLMSRTSSSLSGSLKRSLSDAHIRRESSRLRSASLAISQHPRHKDLLQSKHIADEKYIVRRTKLGAYFSSGSNCSSLNDVPLRAFNLPLVRHCYRERFNSLPNSPLFSTKESTRNVVKSDDNKTKPQVMIGKKKAGNEFKKVRQAASPSNENGKDANIYLKYNILTSPVIHLVIL